MSHKTYTIALDAMGGDNAPAQTVAGAVIAAQETSNRILLVGNKDLIEKELSKHTSHGSTIEIVPSEGVVSEREHPVRALRNNPKSSIATAVGLVKQGKADAVVSVGSTGATMAAAVLLLGVFPGLERPTLGGPFISLAPSTSIIDLGAQIDCRPAQLLSFAALGTTYTRLFQGISNPRVALLSVGSEEGKGNRQVQEAFPLFQGSGLNFVGNIEGHELLMGKAEVVVCDGFVGNILLKYTEGLAEAAARHMAASLGNDNPAVQAIRSLAGAAERAGGPLLGANGVVMIGHGRAPARSIANAIHSSAEFVKSKLVETMRTDLEAIVNQSSISRNGGLDG
jgi:glycerol-3-phosphate acyltransferase PlsX